MVLGNHPGGDGPIIRQAPVAGARVPPGSTVTVTLSATGVPPEPLIAVPDLSGRTVEEARDGLHEAGLTLDPDAGGTGRVAGQDPAAGVLVPRGTPVSVSLTTSDAAGSPTA